MFLTSLGENYFFNNLLVFLRLNFLQKWKEELKIWNSRNQENFVFTFVSSCLR